MSALNNKIVIIGGKLQGMEACYLAMKAGIETILVDKNPNAPAKHLCSKFVCEDIFEHSSQLLIDMKEADIVLPALENAPVLQWLNKDAKAQGYTLAFDWHAYQISSSKRRSDELFRKCGIPVPLYFPGGCFPYICKPDSDSGSHGVMKLKNSAELHEALDKNSDLVIQEYLEGPSYSIEIIGKPGMYRTYLVTQIHIDQKYDCRMVTAPCGLTGAQEDTLRKMAFTIAEEIKLHGIMDLEVILAGGELKLLEIDARIPSQTPAAILHSTGVNLLAELYDLFCGRFEGDPLTETRGAGRTGDGTASGETATCDAEPRYASYEHYLVEDGNPRSLGEHIMTQGGALRLETGAWGADEAVTDYTPDARLWRGIFMNSGATPAELEQKRARTLQALRERKRP